MAVQALAKLEIWVEPTEVEDTTSFEAPYDDSQLDPLNDAQETCRMAKLVLPVNCILMEDF